MEPWVEDAPAKLHTHLSKLSAKNTKAVTSPPILVSYLVAPEIMAAPSVTATLFPAKQPPVDFQKCAI